MREFLDGDGVIVLVFALLSIAGWGVLMGLSDSDEEINEENE